jgi:hypothetical protein
MKIRSGFVSNSSSSSFIVISAGNDIIVEDGDSESLEMCGSLSLDIDVLIGQLTKAKANGVREIHISHGGGYEG